MSCGVSAICNVFLRLSGGGFCLCVLVFVFFGLLGQLQNTYRSKCRSWWRPYRVEGMWKRCGVTVRVTTEVLQFFGVLSLLISENDGQGVGAPDSGFKIG